MRMTMKRRRRRRKTSVVCQGSANVWPLAAIGYYQMALKGRGAMTSNPPMMISVSPHERRPATAEECD